MNGKKWTGLIGAFGMIVLILRPETAFAGAAQGIDICLKTVIPSLFPFFVISSVLSNSMQPGSGRWLRPLGQLCGIPKGSETILLLGLCGGYPVGAKSLYDVYAANIIKKNDAERMLCFCNIAGPSFIFGIAASMFALKSVPWFLWFIQIASMILTASILPNKSANQCQMPKTEKKKPMEQALKSMATVCGWIIFMRVLISLINSILDGRLPQILFLMITGILELSNGCITLADYSDPILRYILMGQFLSFGGICIILQIKTLIGDLNIKYYIAGKILQTAFSSALIFLSIPFLFPGNYYWMESAVCIGISVILIFAAQCAGKNNSGNYSLHVV